MPALPCARCTIPRNVVNVIVHDEKTNKDWKITKCQSCGFNIDLNETKILPTPRSKWTL